MSRYPLIKSLSLVNVNGISERTLDLVNPHEFAHNRQFGSSVSLLGNNGAGKTTLLGAFMLALIPDVRFISLGTSDEFTPKNKMAESEMFARLGNPCLVGLEIKPRQSDVHALYLIRCERATGTKIDTRFFRLSLPTGIKPLDCMVEYHEQSLKPATIDMIRDKAAQLGCQYRQFDNVDAYMLSLFEDGILPRPCKNPADKRKLAQIFHSAMAGKRDKAIERHLSDFLITQPRTDIKTVVEALQTTMRRLRQTGEELTKNSIDYNFFRTLLSTNAEISARAWAQVEYRYSFADKERSHCQQQFDDVVKKLNDNRASEEQIQKQIAEIQQELEKLGPAREELTRQIESAKSGAIYFKQREDASVALIALKPRFEEVSEQKLRHSAEMGQRRTELLKLKKNLEDIVQQLANQSTRFELAQKKAGLYKQACDLLEMVEKDLGKALDLSSLPALLSQQQEETNHLGRAGSLLKQQLDQADDIIAQHQDATTKILLTGDQIEPHQAQHWFLNKGIQLRKWEPCAAQLDGLTREQQSLVNDQRQAVRIRDEFLTIKLPRFPLDLGDYNGLLIERREAEREASGVLSQLDENHKQKQDLHEELKGGLLDVQTRHIEWVKYQPTVERLKRHHPDQELSAENLPHLTELLRKQNLDFKERITELNTEKKKYEQRLDVLKNRETGTLELLRQLSGLINGIPVADLYADIAVDEAGFTEAALGPLMQGILVADPEEAARTLLAEYGDNWILDDLVLLSPGEGVSIEQLMQGQFAHDLLFSDLTNRFVGDNLEFDPPWCVLEEPSGMRVSKVRIAPVLGERAREALIGNLEVQLSQTIELLDKTELAREQVIRSLEDCRYLSNDPWLALSCEPPLKQLQAQIADIEEQMLESKRQLQHQHARLEQLRLQATTLDRYGICAELLFRDFPSELEQIQVAIEQSNDASRLLSRYKETVYYIEQQCPFIRQNYPDDIAQLRHDSELAQTTYMRAAQLLSSLRMLYDVEDHFTEPYQHASKILKEEEGATELLRNQMDKLNEDISRLTGAGIEQRKRENELNEESSRLAAEINGKNDVIGMANRELSALPYVYESGLVTKLTAQKQVQDEQSAKLSSNKGKFEQDLRDVLMQRGQLEKEERITDVQLAEAIKTHQSLLELRTATVKALEKSKVHHELASRMRAILAQELDKEPEISVQKLNSLSMAAQKYGLPEDDPYSILLNQEEHDSKIKGLKYLGYYVAAIALFRRRARQDLIRALEPEEMLEQLEAACESAKRTLDNAKQQFMTDRSELGDAIYRRISDEQRAIRQLSKEMQGIEFGQIAEIRLVPEMKREYAATLDVLRTGGQGMDDLFNQTEDLSEALKRLYQHATGGQIEGEKLLDHKNYMVVKTEIRRKGRDIYEPLLDSTLSTGERIGSGLVVLIAIMKNWGRMSHGNKPFAIPLVLDEASRLDAHSQKTVHELARRTGSQILLAAPESLGKIIGTGYQLVRTTQGKHGQHQVKIHGIRDIEALKFDEDAFLRAMVGD